MAVAVLPSLFAVSCCSLAVQEQLVPICRIWSTSRGQATFNVQHTINMTVRGHDSMERGSFSHLYIVN